MTTGQPMQVPHKTEKRIFMPKEYIGKEFKSPGDRLLYADQDVDVLFWSAEPGKTHLDVHKHPHSAHVYFIIQGEGEALMGKDKWEKVTAGQVIVNPRGKVHALRNTMSSGTLAWISATAVGAGSYIRVDAPPSDE